MKSCGEDGAGELNTVLLLSRVRCLGVDTSSAPKSVQSLVKGKNIKPCQPKKQQRMTACCWLDRLNGPPPDTFHSREIEYGMELY
jgi:hypothetical protein